MSFLNEEIHYQSRFTVTPEAGSRPAIQFIRERLWSWVLDKERRRRGTSLIDELRAGDAKGSFLDGGLELPSDKGRGDRPELMVDAFADRDGGACWAMDYDEPDGGIDWRRWHTKVGLRSLPDGSCLVNVFNGFYILPEYFGRPITKPHASVPFFVKEIFAEDSYVMTAGGTPLHRATSEVRMGRWELLVDECDIYLTPETFDSKFRAQLLDPAREIPLVATTTDWEGRTPVHDADRLALDLLGMANVYVIDWRDAGIRAKTMDLFRYGEPSYEYRCGVSQVRVYRPHINLRDPNGSRNHPYFRGWRIESIYEAVREPREQWHSDPFADTLVGMLGLSIRPGGDDVLDLDDVEQRRSQAREAELGEQVKRLKERAAETSAPSQAAIEAHAAKIRERMDRLEREARAADEAARQAALDARRQEDLVARLRKEARDWQALAEETDRGWRERWDESQASWQAALEGKQGEWQAIIDLLEEENGKDGRRLSSLKRKNTELQGEAAEWKRLCGEANERADAAAEEAAALGNAMRTIAGLDHMPDSLTDLLDLAERLWGSRIRILDEARASAGKFKGDLDEEWQIIKSVPTVLWEIYFDEDDNEGQEDRLYQEACGFELALTEGKLTRNNGTMMRERERTYMGRTISCVSHIKGKRNLGRGKAFRLYYYADRENKLIVIGHCGDHLNTAGTQKQR